MRIGLGLITCQTVAGDRRTWTDLYSEALQLCRLAENLGFDSVWTPEHHFFPDGYMSAPLTFAAAAVAVTTRLKVGQEIMLAPLYDPVHLAEEAATIDQISGGRLMLGVGTGWRREEFDVFAPSWDTRAHQLSECVRVLRGAFGDEPFTFEGEFHTYRDLYVTPKPVQRPSVPILMGAYTDPGIRRAARLGDGYIVPFPGYEEADRRKELALATVRSAGRDPEKFSFTFHQAFHVTDDCDAFEEALPHLHYMSAQLAQMGEAKGQVTPAVPGVATREQIDRYRSSIIAGDPARAAEWVDTFRDHFGDDTILIARLYLPGLAFERQVRAIELFAKSVLTAPLSPVAIGGA
jgi:probable F420-dependent oxidoreductase